MAPPFFLYAVSIVFSPLKYHHSVNPLLLVNHNTSAHKLFKGRNKSIGFGTCKSSQYWFVMNITGVTGQLSCGDIALIASIDILPVPDLCSDPTLLSLLLGILNVQISDTPPDFHPLRISDGSRPSVCKIFSPDCVFPPLRICVTWH